MRSAARWLVLVMALLPSCSDLGETVPRSIGDDAELFALITLHEPFRQYVLFPNADSVVSGALNGSSAHQPRVRVSMNARAFNALRNGRLPNGASFPDGSIIFKQIRTGSDSVVLYAVMYKDRTNPFADSTSGWLWAEFTPQGVPFISLMQRGRGCVGCHAREQGLQHDLVRTFERQR